MKTKTVHQKISFAVSAHDVYEVLMTSKKHSQLTGGPATISRKVGGKFSVYDEYATGENIELIPDKKIVQTWHASDWEEGYFSTVTFIFNSSKTGCTLSFTHEGVPINQFASIKKGWIDFYWKPLKQFFPEG